MKCYGVIMKNSDGLEIINGYVWGIQIVLLLVNYKKSSKRV